MRLNEDSTQCSSLSELEDGLNTGMWRKDAQTKEIFTMCRDSTNCNTALSSIAGEVNQWTPQYEAQITTIAQMDEQIKKLHEDYEVTINQINERHKAVLDEKDREIFKLCADRTALNRFVSCKDACKIDYSIYGEFLAELAIQQSFAELKEQSAQTILSQDELFWQYLLLTFPEFEALLIGNDQGQILKFVNDKAKFFIQIARQSMVTLVGNTALKHVNTDLVLDMDKNAETNAITPVFMQGEDLDILELHIAPANAEGISFNKFKKFDTRQLKGILLVNSLEEAKYKGGFASGNENLKYSLTENLLANHIVIEITDPESGDTFLHGSIEIAGQQAKLEIINVGGIGVDYAFLEKIEELHIKSQDTRHYEDCSSYPCARNIRINTGGLHANCPVFFYAKHVVIDGLINIPNNNLTLHTDSNCRFSTNARIIQAGGVNANCYELFLNHGNIAVQGPLNIQTGSFINEPQWYKAPWTQTMKDAVNPDFLRKSFQLGTSHSVPWDDLDDRQYDAKMPGSGFIMAHDFNIRTRGDFLNQMGAHISDYGGKSVTSYIIANGRVFNGYKRCATEYGFLKEGFRIEPSTLYFSGNAFIHSEVNSIVTDASIFVIEGDCFKKAGTYILELPAEGSYLENYIYHYAGDYYKRKGAMPVDQFKRIYGALPGKGLVQHDIGKGRLKEIWPSKSGALEWRKTRNIIWGIESPVDGPGRYKSVFAPSIIQVKGNAFEIAGEDIIKHGSIHLVGGNAQYKAAGNFIFKGLQIKPANQEHIQQQLYTAIGNGENGQSVVLQHAHEALVFDNNQPFKIGGGIMAIEGNVIIETGKQVLFDTTTFVAAGDINITAKESLKITGNVESYVKQKINPPKHKMITHGFVKTPAVIASNSNVCINSPEVFLVGALLSATNDITFIVGNLYLKPEAETAENYQYKKKKNWFSTTQVTQRSSTSDSILSGVIAQGNVRIKAQNVECEGCMIASGKNSEIDADNIRLKTHVIPQYIITNKKESGLRFPGICNVILDTINGKSTSASLKNNIAIVGAIDGLAKIKSPTDFAPVILFAAETYSMANNIANTYLMTGSSLAAFKDEALNQLGLTTVGGIPIPSSIGYGKTKTHHQKRWTEGFVPYLIGQDITVNAKEAYMNGVIIDAVKNVNLNIAETLHLNSQKLEGNENWKHEGKFVTLTYKKDSIGISGTRQSAKSNSYKIRHLLPKILAGESVTINVGQNAEVEGLVSAPQVKVEVAGTLNLRTVQNSEKGRSSQLSVRAGLTYSASKQQLRPDGGFQKGKGDWYKCWADQQATISGNYIEIKAKNIILEGAAILGKSGYVNAESIKSKDLENIREEHSTSYGVDTDFVRFLVKPQNSQQSDSANAIKGMALISHSDESEEGILRATISNKLTVNVDNDNDLRGLNRDESKAQETFGKSSHHFSLAIPAVDWKQLSEDLHKIGTTAKDINQRVRGSFERAKQHASTPEAKTTTEVQEKLVEEFYETLEENKVLTNLEKDETFKDFVQTVISEECREFIAVSNAKEQIIGEKPVEAANAQELLLLANAISQSTEIHSSDKTNVNREEKSRLLDNYVAELAEYGIDIAIETTFAKAKHLPTTLVGKIADQVGNKIIQIERGFNEIALRFFNKIADKPAVILLRAMYHNPLGEKELKYVGGKAAEAALYSAEYVLGPEMVVQIGEAIAKAGEHAVKDIEYIIDHSTQGQRKFVGSGVDIAANFLPFFKGKITILAAAMVGVKKGLKPDVSDGVEALIKTGLKKELKTKQDLDAEKVTLAVGKQSQHASISGNLGREIYPKEVNPQIVNNIRNNVVENRIALQSSRYGELTVQRKLPLALEKEFENGGSWIMTEADYERHVLNKEIIGRSDGQFMTSTKKMNKVLKVSDGDISKLQELLSTKGWVGKKLYRIDIKNPLDYNPRLPHEGLSGVNDNFIPGGFTKGNMPEIITDALPKNQLTITKIN